MTETDRKSWAVKGEAVLDDLTALIGLSGEEKALLLAMKGAAEAVGPQLSEAFYQRVLNHPHTAEYVGGKVEHLKGTLKEWFVQLFAGEYGQSYVQRRLRIGEMHVQIGLPVRYPLAMLDLIVEFGLEVTSQSTNPEAATTAFRKLVALDIAIFNQAYEDSQLKHLAEMVGNERLARRLLTQEQL
jgi:hypothetical protein